jgi:hypothetical protein
VSRYRTAAGQAINQSLRAIGVELDHPVAHKLHPRLFAGEVPVSHRGRTSDQSVQLASGRLAFIGICSCRPLISLRMNSPYQHSKGSPLLPCLEPEWLRWEEGPDRTRDGGRVDLGRAAAGWDRQGQGGWGYKGRPATLDHQKIAQLHKEGRGATDIARAVGCSRGAVYKALNAAEGRRA